MCARARTRGLVVVVDVNLYMCVCVILRARALSYSFVAALENFALICFYFSQRSLFGFSVFPVLFEMI